MASALNMIMIIREEANGDEERFDRIHDHVMDAITRSARPEEFGVRNPAPSYSELPTGAEVTVELAVAVPEYRSLPPRYTRASGPLKPLAGRKRKWAEMNGDEEDELEEQGSEE